MAAPHTPAHGPGAGSGWQRSAKPRRKKRCDGSERGMSREAFSASPTPPCLGGQLPPTPTPSRRSQEFSTTFEPGLVVLPWRRDPHCDHRASWSLGMDAVSACNRSPDVLEYSIWLDELGEPGDHPEDGGDGAHLAGGLERRKARMRFSPIARSSASWCSTIPTGFVLGPETITRLTGPEEVYWRQCNAR